MRKLLEDFMKKICMETKIGLLTITEEEGAITEVLFGKVGEDQTFLAEATPILQEAEKQLAEYFAGIRKAFDLPLAPEGTDFQKSVWQALQQIPYGETRSYKEIATAVGNPKASRAVGLANNRNPISIVIPCHRVIGANGKLVGYGGGLGIKEALLQLEKNRKMQE